MTPVPEGPRPAGTNPLSRVLIGRWRIPRAVFLVPALVLAAGITLVICVNQRARASVQPFGLLQFDEPSRLYARPVSLEVGDQLGKDDLVELLIDLGYRRSDQTPTEPGSFQVSRQGLRIVTHSLPLLRTTRAAPAKVEVAFTGRQIARLQVDGAEGNPAILDVPVLATFYGSELRECRPVKLEELPPHVVQAFLAVEDHDFYGHPGISLRGILRAALVNMRHGKTIQGGSTITQQLVKNLFLTSERSYARKLREAFLAVALEERFSKKQILEAYLNEVYLGNLGGVNLIGIGAAARGYFGKEATELSLAEAATLAGLVAAPGRFNPLRYSDRAVARRNHVLERLGGLGWASADEVKLARANTVTPRPLFGALRRAPHFADAMAVEARQRYGIKQLAGAGYALFSTLDWQEQWSAERSVRSGLAQLEKRREKANTKAARPLQAALVSLDPATGALRSYLGGRDYDRSQYDRVRQARRQAGSTFKPIVYAAALAGGVAQPYYRVADAPLIVQYGDQVWQPYNYDREFRGWVTVRQAIEASLNIPTIRIAVATGLDRIERLASDLGIERTPGPHPSLALGALDVSPLQLASVYAGLASGGIVHTPYGLEAVFDGRGRQLQGEALPPPRRVLEEAVAFQVTELLRGVVDQGTGHGVRQLGLHGAVAGKTGTSDDRRDSWFAGYTPDRVAVAWVGYDDNRPTRLTGSQGALPIWTRFMLALRGQRAGAEFEKPSDLAEIWIDPETGGEAGPQCPTRTLELIPTWQTPPPPCTQHTFMAGEVIAYGESGEIVEIAEQTNIVQEGVGEELFQAVVDDGSRSPSVGPLELGWGSQPDVIVVSANGRAQPGLMYPQPHSDTTGGLQ